MILYFNAKLEALRLTPHEFFHIAHVALFNRDAQLEDDFAQYLMHGVLPKYVVNYLKRMQQHELHEVSARSTPDPDGSVRQATHGEDSPPANGLLAQRGNIMPQGDQA